VILQNIVIMYLNAPYYVTLAGLRKNIKNLLEYFSHDADGEF